MSRATGNLWSGIGGGTGSSTSSKLFQQRQEREQTHQEVAERNRVLAPGIQFVLEQLKTEVGIADSLADLDPDMYDTSKYEDWLIDMKARKRYQALMVKLQTRLTAILKADQKARFLEESEQ